MMDKVRMFNDDGTYTPVGLNMSNDFARYLSSAGYFGEQYNAREISHLLMLEILIIECESLIVGEGNDTCEQGDTK